MRSLLRVFGMSAALALLAMPATAQDDETPAAEAEPTPAERAAKRAARKAELRAWHAKQKAIREAKERAAAERAAAEAAGAAEAETAPVAAEAAAPAADEPTAIDAGSRLDSGTLDALPAAGPSHAVATEGRGDHMTATDHGHGAAEHAAGTAAQHAGAHDEHGGFSVGTFVLQVINFAALLFILIYFGGRAMSKALRAKHEQLKSEIGEAARLRDDAQGKLAVQDRRMAELEKEIAALRTSMRDDAEREQARLVETAQARGRKIQDDMRLQIDEQVKVAEAALRAEVASASVALAEDLIRKAVSFEDERRLAREFVAGFGRPGTPSPDEEVR